jgi:hypothetical protein
MDQFDVLMKIDKHLIGIFVLLFIWFVIWFVFWLLRD